jgi:hypothetical protein
MSGQFLANRASRTPTSKKEGREEHQAVIDVDKHTIIDPGVYQGLDHLEGPCSGGRSVAIR